MVKKRVSETETDPHWSIKLHFNIQKRFGNVKGSGNENENGNEMRSVAGSEHIRSKNS